MNSGLPGASPRILIVDDERRSARLLEIILEPLGFVLEVATGGEEALAMVAMRRPDLILLDIMMPGLDGYEVATIIRANPATKSIPIIMLSVLGDRDARMLGLSAGADDFLTKPVDRAELSARVRNLLRLKAYGDYHEKYSRMLESEVMARTAELEEHSRTLEAQAHKMRHSEERTNFALSSAGMGVWEVELATNTIAWSDSLAAVHGLAPSEVPKTPEAFFALIHPDDRASLQASAVHDPQTDDFHEVEFRMIWPDGSLHWAAGRSRVERGPDGTTLRLLGVTTDISARKLLEGQLRQSQKMEAIGQLAGGVAHDFNNLLTAILGYSGFVIETLDESDPRHADMEQIIKAGERATGLTRQLLAFSRKQVLQPIILNVNEVVRNLLAMLTRVIGEHIELVPILPDGVGTVCADRGQLEQVLMNLVVNARDAMPSGGRIVITTENVELDQSWNMSAVIKPGPYLMLSVSDNGTGMSEATRLRLFEPFFTTKEQGKGTGLGLATVYGIVHQSGGHIWVYSEPGLGATFKVYLPRFDSAEEVRLPPPLPSQLPAPTETLLLVEDDASVRELTRTILVRAGYRVYDARDPMHAEELFAKHRAEIAMLVSDVIMPGSSGPKLYERLLREKPALKVLYVSGYTDDAIVSQGNLDPEIDFLQKPFTSAALNQRVREVLSRRVGG